MIKMNASQVLKKYKGKYIDVYKLPYWDSNSKGEQLYEVRKSYSTIHENTTLVKDINFINNY